MTARLLKDNLLPNKKIKFKVNYCKIENTIKKDETDDWHNHEWIRIGHCLCKYKTRRLPVQIQNKVLPNE